MPETFETLIEKAESLLNLNDWKSSRNYFDDALEINQNHIGVLIGISICHLRLNEPTKAIAHLEKVTELAADSAESWINLASAYLAAKDLDKAEKYYIKATDLDPDNLAGWKMLARMYLAETDRMQEGVHILAAIIEDHPTDTDALYLLGQCYEAGEDVDSAVLLYERLLTIDPGHLEAIQALGVLKHQQESNSNQELLKKISSLKGLKQEKKHSEIRIAFYSNGEVSDTVRVINPARALHDAGCEAYAGEMFKDEHLRQYDYFVFSRPQITKTQMDGLEKCKEAGKTIFVDLDDDFMNIPRSHPGYKTFGPGDKSAIERLKTALSMANYLTTPSQVISERYAKYVPETIVIPNNWWKGNELWLKPGQKRKTINIGWAGTITHRKDFRLVIKALEKIVKRFDQVQIVIGGDPKVFDLCSVITDDRKMFLPMVPHEDYPYMLSHFDILLAPLENTKFNQAKSDIKLLEAGIRKIPWAASPLPAYQDWAVGGLIADTTEEWEAALGELVENDDLRKYLGEAGHEKALTRESKFMSAHWLEILSGLK